MILELLVMTPCQVDCTLHWDAYLLSIFLSQIYWRVVVTVNKFLVPLMEVLSQLRPPYSQVSFGTPNGCNDLHRHCLSHNPKSYYWPFFAIRPALIAGNTFAFLSLPYCYLPTNQSMTIATLIAMKVLRSHQVSTFN